MVSKIVLMGLAAVLMLGTANAAIVPTFVNMNNIGGGVFSYIYDINLESPGERIQIATQSGPNNTPPGGFDNHFTIFDFFGFVPGSASCAGSSAGAGFCSSFTFSTANVGPSAFVQSPPDSPNIANLTWAYNNSATVIPAGTYLGRITVNSTSGTQGAVYFSAQSTKDTGPFQGTVTGNTVLTVGPVSGPVSAIPEPATMLLLGCGLIALGLVHKKYSST